MSSARADATKSVGQDVRMSESKSSESKSKSPESKSNVAHRSVWIACAALIGLAACGSSSPKAQTASTTTTQAESTTSTGSASTTTVVVSSPATVPTTPTTSASTTSATEQPVLGRSWSPNQSGYGAVRPAAIDNGGDPTGKVEDVQWQSWGRDRATGSGFSYYVAPGKIVADGSRQPATVVAFDLGTCKGVHAYTAIEWYFPQHGETFDPNSYINICTGDHVGDK
jgi:hypothetical protein